MKTVKEKDRSPFVLKELFGNSIVLYEKIFFVKRDASEQMMALFDRI